jgi:hypothetical protein
MSDASPASQAAVLPGLALAGALAAAAFAIRAEDWRPLAPGAAAAVFMGALAFVPVALPHG